jgi:hypothetical protein
MVLFPASIDHAVLENGTPEERRVSIAMDFYLTAPVAGVRAKGVNAVEGVGGEGEAEYLAPHPSTWLEVGEFAEQADIP